MNALWLDGIIDAVIDDVRAQGVQGSGSSSGGAVGELGEVGVDVRHVMAALSRHADFQRLKVSERRYIQTQVLYAVNEFDVITELLDDPTVTEVMVNGPDDIFFERDGELYKSSIHFRSQKDALNTAAMIVGKINRKLSFEHPIEDARLPQGYRFNVVRDPVALNAPAITIRKFSKRPMDIAFLLRNGAITPEAAANLRRLVRAKYNIFVCGGTGSGKTTFLNALSNFIPDDERIVTIEDPAELNLASIKNLVRLETKGKSNTKQGGESEPILIRDLIRAALRMRPDRIIVGEVRGEEALDMLQAMNTGHEGSMSTGHANSNEGMIRRLESMILVGGALPIPVIRSQMADALDIMVHLGRLRDRSRRVLEIVEVRGLDADGQLVLRALYRFEERGEDENGRVVGDLVRTDERLENTEKLRFAGDTADF